jgi:ATP-dependent DNA ligase
MSIYSAYSQFAFIFPPRAETTIHPKELELFGSEWIAEPKFNGSCAMLFINGRRDYKIYNKYGLPLTLQKPIDYTNLNDNCEKYMVLSGEYLNKNNLGEDGRPFNHKFIIWDILVWRGEYLINYTVADRLKILETLFDTKRGWVNRERLTLFNHLHPTNTEHVFLAPWYKNDFKLLYDNIIKTDLYEGLVLKRADGKLEPGFREKNNTSWQVKARKATNLYDF